MIPLAVSQVLCELIMIVLHIDLNIDSLPVAAVGVGVGIDYGIYLMSRLREEAFDYDFDQARLRGAFDHGQGDHVYGGNAVYRCGVLAVCHHEVSGRDGDAYWSADGV